MSRVFVLSAGRTGTVFLTHTLPSRVPGLFAVHEAPGSRALLMLGNLAARVGRGDRPLRAALAWALDARRHDEPAVDLEVNPMLVPLTHLLPALGPLRVVHMVRHPASWVRSIRSFRASGYRRHLIDFVPFGTPFPTPRPEGWRRLDQVQRALWRWRHCNERIEALAQTADRYVRLRYEDLFVADRDTRERALRELLTAIDRPAPADLDQLLDAPPANPAPSGQPVDVLDADVAAICGPMLSRYGYAISEPSTR
jgi:hypothetical protein